MSAPAGVFIDIGGYCLQRVASGGEHVVFVLNIRFGAFQWTVYRRREAFQTLSDMLRSHIPDAPECPPEKPIGAMDTPTFLESIRQDLLGWIRLLATDERVCRSPGFHEFLRDGANTPPPGLVEVDHLRAAAAVLASPGAGGTAGRPPRPVTEADGTSRVGLKHFSLLKVVGKGSFGKVMQVRKKDSGRIYAMKVLTKSNIIRRNQVEHTRTERNVLGRITHPFIVSLNYAFQSTDKLYFVLDYCAGGELFFHLGKEGKFEESRARFYAAQITLALEHLHTLDVIYRDLKPENVLLSHEGNVRLTDFGLSKENVSEKDRGAHTFCGTPEYIAPEILNRSGHGRAVDWWSLGALLYEMLTGLPPFYCRDHKALFDKIRRGRLEFPAYLSAEARDLLNGLLTRDPLRRLGCGPRDAAEIKGHPFFAGVDWSALLAKEVPAPWLPVVVGSQDTSQFDQEFTSMPIVSPPGSKRGISASVARVTFEGFTFQASPQEAAMGEGRAAGAVGGAGAGAGAGAGRSGSPLVSAGGAAAVAPAAGAAATSSPAALPVSPAAAPRTSMPPPPVPHHPHHHHAHHQAQTPAPVSPPPVHPLKAGGPRPLPGAAQPQQDDEDDPMLA